MKKYDLDLAHAFSNGHKPELEKDHVCGCFYCLAIFDPAEITEWIIEDNDCDRRGTAICPYCEIDSVIGESSGFPITKEFLQAMNRKWFSNQEINVFEPENQNTLAEVVMKEILELNPEWDGDEAELLTQIGYACEKGTIFKQNYKAAIKFYMWAGEAGNAQAISNLGWMYENGLGVACDIQKATYFFETAAKAGNIAAMLNLGNIYEYGMLDDEPDYKQCYKWYRMAAEAGDPKGKFDYANCYHWGYGVRKNYKKAFSIFKDLADNGYPGAAFYVGLYYQEGYAVERDYEKARAYYRQGALEDDMYCYNQLGVLYSRGLGVEKDIRAAFDYYKKAAEMGEPAACRNIAHFYENGYLGKVDIPMAVKWYQLAVMSGEESANEDLERLGYLESEDIDEEEWV